MVPGSGNKTVCLAYTSPERVVTKKYTTEMSKSQSQNKIGCRDWLLDMIYKEKNWERIKMDAGPALDIWMP